MQLNYNQLVSFKLYFVVGKNSNETQLFRGILTNVEHHTP